MGPGNEAKLVDMDLDLTVCENVGFEIRRCSWVSFLQAWISRMDSCGASEKEKADTEDDSN